MNRFKTKVNRIVNKYLNWEKWCEENDEDKDNDELYKVWLITTTEEIGEEICNELIELCEDNEYMARAIREYFGEKPEEDVDNIDG